MSSPSNSTFPVALAPRTSSCMRLRHRTNVDLPHPDGPITAVTAWGFAVIDTFFRTWFEPNQAFRSETSILLTSGVMTTGSGEGTCVEATEGWGSLTTITGPYSAAWSRAPSP